MAMTLAGSARRPRFPMKHRLYAVLQWNLESTTIVAWKLSDSVFVESGNSEFTHNALVLLVLALNFSHSESAESCTLDATITKGVKTRNWYLDPYMSDFDIRQIMRQFPPAKRLEGRPTGTKMHTRLDRLNVHGQLDESHNFFDRWCIIL
ncbi:uncharacterized protein PHALS_10417 [Plasmopara halstedii]|uniref:Uncharacterized protein n=1 Tax=Plasmopara halstedii TaxID=4781 RepID=A0A0P1AGF9_PLAHL|nr:uncharacterized protein PHALS_10417 [Plasmopara halstedii]CEG40205.1 hypothetical protein PHALS_10417 [Plasmopara halstedii]|eukprot:XP_024576574.1 hypothetical protein PHALS_10417 [Plasmopara halstedii]